MRKEKILALPIAELGLSATASNNWAERLKEQEDPELEFGWGDRRRRLCEELARQFTVKDLIADVDEQIQDVSDYFLSWNEYFWIGRQLRDKLVELGLTQLDWIVLPNRTVTIEMLKRLGKKNLLRYSILVLGTLSSKAISSLQYEQQKMACQITIRDLLNISLRTWKEREGSNFSTSIANTRQRLRELGYNYGDGVFLQDGTKRQLAEDLRDNEGLSWKVAQKLAGVAEKRGWVARFVD